MTNIEDDLYGAVTEWDGVDPIRPEDADRLLWRLRKVEREIEANHALAMAEINAILAWEVRRGEVLAEAKARLEESLEGWARANHRDTGRVTWDLPHGVVMLRAPRYSVVVEDQEVAVKALLARGDEGLVKTEQSVRRGDLLTATVGRENPRPGSGVAPIERPPDEPDHLDYFRAVLEGEILPGLHLTLPNRRSFSQRAHKDAPAEEE